MKFNLFKKSKEDSIKDRYENDPLNPDLAVQYILDTLSNQLGIKNSINDKSIYCPEIDLSITPVVGELTPQSAMLDFYLYSPKWGKKLYECSVAVAGETKKSVEMSCGSFLFSFINVIFKMELEGESQMTERFSTAFAENIHNWQVYVSDVVGMGESPNDKSPIFYWDLLKSELVKRLGNQKLCYVKVYGAKINGNVTGECRIDDVKSDELSEIVAKEVEKWDVEKFASHKVFFFIRQEDSTVTPYPYFGTEGEELLKEKVKIAATAFFEVDSEEKYNGLTERLVGELGDAVLAEECFSFLPEICAEYAFPDDISYSEKASIIIGGKEAVTCYKNQLSDYHRLGAALFDIFNSGYFGEKTNDIYRQYINVSATGSLIAQAREKGTKGAKQVAISFQFSDDFEIR